MESIYWVVSRDCNQRCAHCYNDSEPGAPGLSLEQISQCVAHLPDPEQVPVGRIILSGGEVLVWPDLLFHALRKLHDRYGKQTQLWVQTNGDLLDEAMLDRLLESHVSRIDVASMDKFHAKGTLQRKPALETLLESRGMVPAESGTGQTVDTTQSNQLVYAFWGATEDEWIGPLWPRGRAHQKQLSKAGPHDRFCGMWSGAIGFLDYDAPGSELNIQLSDVYPCCPMTCRPLGSLLLEPVIAMLDRCREHPVFRALNEGRPEAMGESIGLSEQFGKRRSKELGNHCLWCDEFFLKFARHLDLLQQDTVTERGDTDLVQIGLPRSCFKATANEELDNRHKNV